MNGFVKWAWIILLIMLYAGVWTFAILAAWIVLYFVVRWLRPEWLDRL